MKHIYIKLLVVIFSILSSLSLFAQTDSGTITGKVVDSLGNALPFANVQVKKHNIKATSDKLGAFKLTGVPVGNQQIRVSITGYNQLEQNVTVTANGLTDITFTLKEQHSDLSDVIVSASRRPESLSQTPSSVTVLTAKELSTQSTISPNLANILAYSVPGLGFSTNQTGNSGQTLRGRNVLVLIDGIPQSTPLRAGGRDIRSIDPSVVERVEVIKGATAIYGNGAEGGLINYITKKGDQGKAFGGYSQAGITGNLKGDSTIGYRFSQQFIRQGS